MPGPVIASEEVRLDPSYHYIFQVEVKVCGFGCFGFFGAGIPGSALAASWIHAPQTPLVLRKGQSGLEAGIIAPQTVGGCRRLAAAVGTFEGNGFGVSRGAPPISFGVSVVSELPSDQLSLDGVLPCNLLVQE